ncbi:1884_t:CDS:2 [Gigaspora margarita]|uniref:1884_t:CDS:1 n=1 Tax=Gigaspora margarita TaxID=4874 RepID=A0ABN7UCE2_GIGMA|nr:1884_t:CDS:2 [Gigaspora margarita]
MSERKKKTSTETYIERINGNDIKSVKPFYDPITPKAKNNNLEAWKEDWKNYNQELYNRVAQEKLNLNWIEFSSRFNQCKTLYESIKGIDFTSPHAKNKEINKLIRDTIPNENYSNIYSITTYWRKSYDNLALIFEAFEKDNISKEIILEKLRCTNITINYFQEVNNDDILKLTSCLREVCKPTLVKSEETL